MTAPVLLAPLPRTSGKYSLDQLPPTSSWKYISKVCTIFLRHSKAPASPSPIIYLDWTDDVGSQLLKIMMQVGSDGADRCAFVEPVQPTDRAKILAYAGMWRHKIASSAYEACLRLSSETQTSRMRSCTEYYIGSRAEYCAALVWVPSQPYTATEYKRPLWMCLLNIQ